MAEYIHNGDTTIRLLNVVFLNVIGVNKGQFIVTGTQGF